MKDPKPMILIVGRVHRLYLKMYLQFTNNGQTLLFGVCAANDGAAQKALLLYY